MNRTRNYGYNNMVDQYKNHMKNNIPYNNNVLMNNLPAFQNGIRDPSFIRQMQNQRMEEFKNIHKLDDLKISKKQLQEFIICPIPIEKLDKSRALSLYTERFGEQDWKDKKIPKLLQDWFNERSNLPYKHVLKDQDFNKFINKKQIKLDDLLVYRWTESDKNTNLMKKKFKNFMKLLEKHGDEIKQIYSSSKKAEHYEKFEHVNKYKFRISYDPKDFNDLKECYKKKQKEFISKSKKLDDLIESLMDGEEVTDELKKIEEKNKFINIKEIDFDEELLKNDMKQLKKELGEEEYNKYMDKLKKKYGEVDNEDSDEELDYLKIMGRKSDKKALRKKKSDDSEEKPKKDKKKKKSDSSEEEKPKKDKKKNKSDSSEEEKPKKDKKKNKSDDSEEKPKKDKKKKKSDDSEEKPKKDKKKKKSDDSEEKPKKDKTIKIKLESDEKQIVNKTIKKIII